MQWFTHNTCTEYKGCKKTLPMFRPSIGRSISRKIPKKKRWLFMATTMTTRMISLFFFFFIKKKRFYSRRTEHAFNLDGNVRLMNTNRSSLLRRSFPTLSRCLPTFPLYLSSFLSLPLSLFTPHQHLWFLYKVSHSIQTKNSLYFNGQKYLETFIFSTFFFFLDPVETSFRPFVSST